MAKKTPAKSAERKAPKIPSFLKSRAAVLGLAFAGLVVLILAYLLWGGGVRPFRGNTSDYNVLLVTLDTTRADHLGAYGYKHIRTPILDGLADDGALFEHAYTAAVMTFPSHSSILTGLLPPEHGGRNNGASRLRASAETLAEVLKAAGWHTGAVVGAFVLHSMFGLDQGFESYDDYLPDTGAHDVLFAQRGAREVTDAALKYLAQAKSSKWFLWVHYYDAHSPYRPPSPYREEYGRNGYDGEIAYVDAQLGRLLAAIQEMGARERTILVVVGDHGEGLREHGEQTHGVFVYDETARVPLIIQVPGFLSGAKRVTSVVRTVDVMPTILDLLRLPPRPAAAGTSLWPLMDGQTPDLKLAAFTEATIPFLMYGWSPVASVREGKWKFIESPRRELYDLPADPGEKSNVAGSQAGEVSDLRGKLERIVGDAAAQAKAAESVGLSPEEEAKLRSLGYTGGSEGSKDALTQDPMLLLSGGARGLTDPKDRLQMLDRINRVYQAYGTGEFRAAVDASRSILVEDPSNDSVRRTMGDSYRSLRMFDEALAEYRTLLARNPQDVDVLLSVGYIQMAAGQYDAAKETLDRALAAHPGHAYALASLGNLAYVQGNFDDAASYYKKVLLQRPDHLQAILAMAKIFQRRGQGHEAEVFYEHALDIDPNNVDTLLSLGWLQFSAQKLDDALKTLGRAGEIDPSLPEVHLARGDVYFSQRKIAEAEAEYRAGIAAAPLAPQGYHGLGLVAESRGDLRAARGYFEQALRANPSFGAAREGLKRVSGRAP